MTDWVRRLSALLVACAGTLVGLSGDCFRAVAQEPLVLPAAPGNTGDEDVETLLRGPMHEAFAAPLGIDPEAGGLTERKPPDPVQEIPPEVQPVEEGAVWIPGYWAWDEDLNDFLWVSGIWRVPPPDRRWVPGYWAGSDGGFQWVSGFWQPTVTEDLQYLPYPPRSLDVGPNTPQPSSDYYWVNGNWQYRDGGYGWQPGYWNPYNQGWVWNSPYYSWTPCGAIYVNGYWDYPFAGRGMLFAPTYFRRPLYARPGYFHSPGVAVNVGGLVLNMWTNPLRRHYYWGDYYGAGYLHRGLSPWIHFGRGRYYDPLLAYYRTSYRRQGLDYDQRQQGWYDYFSGNVERRPPRTLFAQTTFAARASQDANLRNAMLGTSVRDLLNDDNRRGEFRRLGDESRQTMGRASREIRDLMADRGRIEGRGGPRDSAAISSTADRPQPGKLEWILPKSEQFASTQTARRPPATRVPEGRVDVALPAGSAGNDSPSSVGRGSVEARDTAGRKPVDRLPREGQADGTTGNQTAKSKRGNDGTASSADLESRRARGGNRDGLPDSVTEKARRDGSPADAAGGRQGSIDERLRGNAPRGERGESKRVGGPGVESPGVPGAGESRRGNVAEPGGGRGEGVRGDGNRSRGESRPVAPKTAPRETIERRPASNSGKGKRADSAAPLRTGADAINAANPDTIRRGRGESPIADTRPSLPGDILPDRTERRSVDDVLQRLRAGESSRDSAARSTPPITGPRVDFPSVGAEGRRGTVTTIDPPALDRPRAERQPVPADVTRSAPVDVRRPIPAVRSETLTIPNTESQLRPRVEMPRPSPNLSTPPVGTIREQQFTPRTITPRTMAPTTVIQPNVIRSTPAVTVPRAPPSLPQVTQPHPTGRVNMAPSNPTNNRAQTLSPTRAPNGPRPTGTTSSERSSKGKN